MRIENWVLETSLIPQTTSEVSTASEELASISATKETREPSEKRHYDCIFLPLSFVGHKTCFWGSHRYWMGWKKHPHHSFPALFQMLNQCWSCRKSTCSLSFQLESKHECKKCGVQQPDHLFFWVKTHVKTKCDWPLNLSFGLPHSQIIKG